MVQPFRVWRRRVKGWRLPSNTVCVSRPSRFGNPFSTAAEFARHIHDRDAVNSAEVDAWLVPLRGKNLACWCPPGRECHGDFLLIRANRVVETL